MKINPDKLQVLPAITEEKLLLYKQIAEHKEREKYKRLERNTNLLCNFIMTAFCVLSITICLSL